MELDAFNALDAADAASVVGVWAAVPRWVDAVVSGRPYASANALADCAAAAAADWTVADLDAALARHPRIGHRSTGDGADAAASRSEQSSMSSATDAVASAIAEGNAAYEERFGRVFLIRAAGRTPDEMLAELRRRLANDEAAEAAEALTQLGEIAMLRLRSTIHDPAGDHS